MDNSWLVVGSRIRVQTKERIRVKRVKNAQGNKRLVSIHRAWYRKSYGSYNGKDWKWREAKKIVEASRWINKQSGEYGIGINKSKTTTGNQKTKNGLII